eukprot:247685-Ditylum_brightwellii.AAC.1
MIPANLHAICCKKNKTNNTECHIMGTVILNLTVLLDVQSYISVKIVQFIMGLIASTIVPPKNLVTSSLPFQIHLILYHTGGLEDILMFANKDT